MSSFSHCNRRFGLQVVVAFVSSVFIVPLVGGCGFQPLYATRDRIDMATELAQIRVNPIGDRIGQVLRNVLLDRITPNGTVEATHYALLIKLNPTTKYLNFHKDNTPSRANLLVSATFQLQDLTLSEHLAVFKGTTHAVASFDILDAPYATVVAEQEAQQCVAHQLAEEILDRVAFYLLNSNAVNRTYGITLEAVERP